MANGNENKANLLTAIKFLQRYFFTGTEGPFSQHIKEVGIVESKINHLQFLTDKFRTIDGEIFVKLVKKCLESRNLPRKNEVWFTYAAYLIDENIKPTEKQWLRYEFPSLATDDEDLFLFVKMSRLILDSKGRNGLSAQIRNTIKLWYKQQNIDDLVKMIAAHRYSQSFTHKDIFKLCHINMEEIRKPDDLLPYIFSRPARIVKQNKNKYDLLTPPLKTLHEIFEFKLTGDINIMKKLIEKKKLIYEHLPTNFSKSIYLWLEMIPVLSYRELLIKIPLMVRGRFFQNEKFNQIFFTALSNIPLMRMEKLHPIFYLIVLQKQAKKLRHYGKSEDDSFQDNVHVKKLQELKKKQNSKIIKKLTKCFVMSFDNFQSKGLRIFITINLQENFKRKNVFNQNRITCMEAAITLAFSYFKSEEKTLVFTYTRCQTLEKIPWTKDCTYKKANEICEKLFREKNYQSTYLPIEEAMKRTEKYDLFLIIVPSAAKRNPQCKSIKLIETLNKYKTTKNPTAKMVIVNLKRSKPAMIHPKAQDDGIFEICGLNEKTPKLIDAFALHQFS